MHSNETRLGMFLFLVGTSMLALLQSPEGIRQASIVVVGALAALGLVLIHAGIRRDGDK